MNVCIAGATGYAGQQLASLLSQHPYIKNIYLGTSSQVDRRLDAIYPHLCQRVNSILHPIENLLSAEFINAHDIQFCFLALPHGASLSYVKKLKTANCTLIDLGSDLRLQNPALAMEWYGLTLDPDISQQTAYGLCELNERAIKQARYIANPGCYATAALLAALPAVMASEHVGQIVIDGKSGISGAGRQASVMGLLSEASENIRPYQIAKHRHIAEIEQALNHHGLGQDYKVHFVPHVVPMSRGLTATVYMSLPESEWPKVQSHYEHLYNGSDFIRLCSEPPGTKQVRGSNFADLHVHYDTRTEQLTAICAIDNLMKGAAGQAVQNMNLILDLPPHVGLDYSPLYP